MSTFRDEVVRAWKGAIPESDWYEASEDGVEFVYYIDMHRPGSTEYEYLIVCFREGSQYGIFNRLVNYDEGRADTSGMLLESAHAGPDVADLFRNWKGWNDRALDALDIYTST